MRYPVETRAPRPLLTPFLTSILVAAAMGQQAPADTGAVRVDATLLLDGVRQVAGHRTDGAWLGLGRGSLVLDGDELGWPGFRATLTFLAAAGSDPARFVRDLQGTDNIAAPDALWPYEAWVQQNIGDRVSVLVGVYDVNSEFDAVDVAGLFLHSSFGNGAEFGLSGPNGPGAYPATGLAVRLATAPLPGLRLRFVAADGSPASPGSAGLDFAWRQDDGTLLAAEAVHRPGREKTREAPRGGRRFLGRTEVTGSPTRIGVGVWRYMGIRAAEGAGVGQGIYLLAETRVGSLRGRSGGTGLFARVGVAAGGPVRAYAGAGVTASGLLGSRPDDELGLGLALAWPDPDFPEAALGTRPETVLELTYRWIATEWLFIQPDLQYIANPAATSRADGALVLSARLALLL